ncbi:precorrin-8X methylmutase [Harryflintia acetispora]|uniref:precorrin-8X methylmutase n=1 Tax=Harryflintia acetispora TaxID=1849041 RepID=UPI0033071C97
MVDIKLEHVAPGDIERRSFEIIEREAGPRLPQGIERSVVQRVIHTTADFDYAENLVFSREAVERGIAALRSGASIVTDTQMAKAGVNKQSLARCGGEVFCFMSDPDIREAAGRAGTTRASACMDKAAGLCRPLIFAIGNAPTALVRLCELIGEGKVRPELVIGVPVGFVNVVQSKELLLSLPVPQIVARGRKGGSNVAAAICNALLYQARERP